MVSTATTWVGRGAKQHQLVGKQDRLARIVRDEDRRGRPRRPDLEQKPPQPVGGALVERDERLVEQQEIGLGGEGACQRHAPGKPERQFLRIARQHVGDADGLGQPTRDRPPMKSGAATSSIFCRTVRQGSRRGSWNMTPIRASFRDVDLADEAVVKARRRCVSSVVLPQPDGPISTVMLSGATSRTKSRIAGSRVPSAPT